MRVLVLGGSGFIGSTLVRTLLARGHHVRVSTRGVLRRGGSAPGQGVMEWVRWDGVDVESLRAAMDTMDAVVNLLGENLAAGRWTPARKERIRGSRTTAGDAITRALTARAAADEGLPGTLLQASACGYYGLWDDMLHAPDCTEASPAGQGFLAETCVAWEAGTRAVEALGVRRCLLRTAPVLGADGGILLKMLPSFQMFAGGVPGSGMQPLSWIHLRDATGAMVHLLERGDLSGPFNLSSPHPVSMRELAQALGRVLHRPVFLRIPGVILRLALGEMAQEMLLSGQKVLPARLVEADYGFSWPRLEDALENILGKKT